MPIDLTIENVPDEVVQALRKRAERNHHSLQGELMAIIESAGRDESPNGVETVLKAVRRLGLSTPREGTAMIRVHRNGR